jgi:hypothetical protein
VASPVVEVLLLGHDDPGNFSAPIEARHLRCGVVHRHLPLRQCRLQRHADHHLGDSGARHLRAAAGRPGRGGLCGAPGPQPQTVTARYSGTLNVLRVNPAPPPGTVPEPGSLALALAALAHAAALAAAGLRAQRCAAGRAAR